MYKADPACTSSACLRGPHMADKFFFPRAKLRPGLFGNEEGIFVIKIGEGRAPHLVHLVTNAPGLPRGQAPGSSAWRVT